MGFRNPVSASGMWKSKSERQKESCGIWVFATRSLLYRMRKEEGRMQKLWKFFKQIWKTWDPQSASNLRSMIEKWCIRNQWYRRSLWKRKCERRCLLSSISYQQSLKRTHEINRANNSCGKNPAKPKLVNSDLLGK